MKIKCINTSVTNEPNSLKYRNLTIGKIYEAMDYFTTDTNYTITDDKGEIYSFVKRCFISLEEHRKNKLNELGI